MLAASTLVPFITAGMFAGSAPAAVPGTATTLAAARAPAISVRQRAPDLPAPRCVDPAAIAAAQDYASHRPGSVSFAVLEHGTLRSFGGGRPYRSASIVKAMLLVADLRRHARSHTPLGPAARQRLASMIRVSSNTAATETFQLVGREAVVSVAQLVGMRNYSVGGWWGTSQVTASDQARFFGRLHAVLPRQYRPFARRLLRTVVPAQTWGGAAAARGRGYVTLFKSGWLPRTDGWVVHQGLRIERSGCTAGIAVLTGQQPSMTTGVASIEGVVRRLLRRN